MRNLAHSLDTASGEPASLRHRPARAAAFPAPEGGDYEAREAAYLRSLLADPLCEIACATTDANARAIAEAASEATASEPFADLARLEDALERIAATTTDDAARAIAEDAVRALPRPLACGRALLANPYPIAESFGVELPYDLPPRFNIAPSQSIAVVRTPGRLELLTWGMLRASKTPEAYVMLPRVIRSAGCMRHLEIATPETRIV